MQTVYKRAGVALGFSILAAFLAINAWFTLYRLEVQISDHALLVHTEQIAQNLTEIELFLDDAETGQRGFLYTGRPGYLEPYKLATSTIDRHLQTLSALTAGDPTQQANLTRLTELTHTKLAELQETITLYNSGKPEVARDLVLSDKGKALMDQIRQQIGEMQRGEDRLENDSVATYARGVWITRASVYAATALSITGLGLLVFYIFGQMELREKYSHELRAREERYRVTLTSIGDGVIATDGQGIVTFLNPVAERLTGFALLASAEKPIAEVFPIFNENTGEPVPNPVEKVLAHGHVVGLANHTVLKNRDGSQIPIEDSAAPIRDDRGQLIGVVLVFRDVTRERESSEIVRRAEKLAAAARLASTVAHEINNPLEAAGNLIYLSKSVPGTPPATLEYLYAAEEQLTRVGHIAKQTLSFYRETRKWEPVDLVGLVDSALRLYSNKLEAKSISIEKEYGACPTLQGSPGELKQVIANLISNAADAVGPNGRIRVVVAPSPSIPGGSSTEQRISLIVEDDGPGIPAENLHRIFEPFFTTKEDVGTGLGLWVSKEIVERHDGSISADSRRDRSLPGAVFTVHLPLESANAGS
jgi:PAS domain S-box-containing protein